MKKICIKCKENKDSKDYGKYSKSSDGLQSMCKVCKRNYDNAYHKNLTDIQKISKKSSRLDRLKTIRSFIFDYLKNKSCSVCGEARVAALDFHHLGGKLFNVSDGVSRGYSLKRIEEEINKCEVLCSNCHRVETSKEFNWYSSIK